MPRRPRVGTGGFVYHVLNRGVGRRQLFDDAGDYLAFLKVLDETCRRMPSVRVVNYCVMPNHWHLVLWPREDGQLSEFMRLLTVTHTQRWHAHRHSAGSGPVYQGRFKSFPVQADEHLLMVCRYVERNAVRANLVSSAARWPWGAAAARARADCPTWLLRVDHWPAALPTDWAAWVDRAETTSELDAVRERVRRGRPFGSDRWETRTAKRLRLETTLRPRGRPRVRQIKDSRPL